jgi:hypothetical protein
MAGSSSGAGSTPPADDALAPTTTTSTPASPSSSSLPLPGGVGHINPMYEPDTSRGDDTANTGMRVGSHGASGSGSGSGGGGASPRAPPSSTKKATTTREDRRKRTAVQTGPPPKIPEYTPMVRSAPYAWRSEADQDAGAPSTSGRKVTRVYTVGVATLNTHLREQLAPFISR